MSTKIRFAVLGIGHIGKRHAAMISSNSECELVAMADIRPKEELGIEDYTVPFFRSVDELLQSTVLFDVLCVATPNGFHEEHAIKGLKAGKHVVIEKPMALSKAGAERIIKEAEQQRLKIFCVMQLRYSPAAVSLKKLLTEERLGETYIVQVNAYWNRDERYYTGKSWHGTKELDGGPLFTQFSHFVDMLYWLFGDITNISARFRNFNHQLLTEFEDSGFIHFDFVKGGSGIFNYSTSVQKKNLESSITIIARNGSIKLGGQYLDELQFSDFRNGGDDIAPDGIKPVIANMNNNQCLYENIIGALQRREPIAATAEEGMKVVEIIERIYAA